MKRERRIVTLYRRANPLAMAGLGGVLAFVGMLVGVFVLLLFMTVTDNWKPPESFQNWVILAPSMPGVVLVLAAIPRLLCLAGRWCRYLLAHEVTPVTKDLRQRDD
jgi:ABC-type branched-subunit amino acid transport system permease subunit